MARELIDRKQINYTWWQYQDGTFSDGVTLHSVIAQMPVIDAVEVIRCKDCQRANRDEYSGCYFCEGKHVNSEHFCSYGERRTDERKAD